MLIVKKIGLAILSPLFIFLLFATAFDIGFVRIAAHPENVKKLVAESGIYDSVVPNVLRQTGSISTSYGNIPVSDPAVQKAINASLPPGYIQQNTELAIDNIYQWLDGKIAQPNFKIDFTGAKTLFANNIADALQKRLNALPQCSLAQSRTILAAGNFDAYNATCLPAGASPAAIAEQAKAGIVSQQDFLKDTVVNASSVKGSNGQPLFAQPRVKDIPKQYQRLKKTPLILSALAILSGVGIVLLSSNWRKGLRHIGINLLVVGTIMLVFSWILNRTVDGSSVQKIQIGNAILQQDIRNLVVDVANQIDKNYWFFGGLYAALGLAALAAARFIKRGQGPGNPDNTAAAGQTPARRPAGAPAAPPKPTAGRAK